MKVIPSLKEMRAFSAKAHRKGKTVGFVPTMGCLHTGHLSLMRKAKAENDYLVISIFVNPTQFGPHEDFRNYPRNFKRDKLLALDAGVDVLFYPQAKDIYPRDYKTYVYVEDLSDVLCGAHRRGHFRGVATVVLKLFNIVQPDTAYFGQKDAQQAVIIKRMVKDLNLGVLIKVLPIVREEDGLAISSRNTYLTEQQRKNAIILYNSLQFAVGMVKSGHKDPRKIIARMRKIIQSKPQAKIEYIKIVDSTNLKEVKRIRGRLLIAACVFFGQTRLIDNVIISA